LREGLVSGLSNALVFSAAAKMLRDARVTRAILRVGGAILAVCGAGLATATVHHAALVG